MAPAPGVDHEFGALFGSDRSLLDVAATLRAARPEPALDPRFQTVLRAQLIAAAASELRPRVWRLLGLGPPHLARIVAGVGAVAAVAAVVVATSHPHDEFQAAPQAVSPIGGNAAVNPGDVITVAFNQPMDHATVLRALGMHPATSFTTNWSGNTLTITPTHHLAVNTPYTVTINRAVARNAGGVAPASDIQISFGTVTGPVPTPAGPVPPPVLSLATVGTAGPGSGLVFAPDGGLVVSAGASAAGAATQSASPGASPSPEAGASATATGARSPSPSPILAGTAQIVEIRSDRSNATLGASSGSVAFSPSGGQISYVRTTAGGGNGRLVVANADGSHDVALAAADAASPVAWNGNDSVVFVSGGRLQSVNLQGAIHPLTTIAAQTVVLAPTGRMVYVNPAVSARPATPGGTTGGATRASQGTAQGATAGASQGTTPGASQGTTPGASQGTTPGATPGTTPSANPGTTPSATPGTTPGANSTASPSSADGSLIDLTSLTSRPLIGSRELVTFSADGSTVAWVDGSQGTPRLVAEATAGGAITTVAALSGTASVTALALSPDGTRLADATADGIFVRTVAGGTEIAESDTPGRALAWSADGRTLAAIRPDTHGDQVETGTVPGTPATPSQPGDVTPPSVLSQVNGVIDAQVRHDRDLLAARLAEGVTTSHLLPGGVSRGYIIGTGPGPAGSAAGTVVATIRLIADATPAQGQTLTGTETVTVTPVHQPTGDTYSVTAIEISPLAAVPMGPQVMRTAQATTSGTTTFEVTCDSDLDPADVQKAVSVTDSSGDRVDHTVVYDADSRTIIVSAANPKNVALNLTLGTALTDVDGQHLSAEFVLTGHA